ncbi:MAG: MCP four helix bundle domain-containing protein [Fulvimarina manganoxydans]|nr:MCP four helix bundle domain-containing protein [Fulvimarina manganoxydans]
MNTRSTGRKGLLRSVAAKVISIQAISFAAMFTVGGLGFYGMSAMNDKMSSIYADRLVSVTQMAAISDGERVVPQEGGFYGGWITSKVAGPFKGSPGTAGW